MNIPKLLMLEWHYEHMPSMFNDYKLCYTDTDSFIYSIKSDNIQETFCQNNHLFDFSNYPENHQCRREHIPSNTKAIGKMKDELEGKWNGEFVGLRSKCYSLKYDDEEKRTCKGISMSAIENKLPHDKYLSMLNTTMSTTISTTMSTIRSRSHKLQTVCINKVALSSYDDKRYAINNHETQPLGHYMNV